MENRSFEKPSAQSFYGGFIEDTQLTVGWKVVRAKVRNMRTNYNKAKEWEGSTGAGSMEGDTIKKFLLESDSTSPSRAECVVEAGSSVEAEELQSPALNDYVCTRRQKGIYSKTALSDSLQVHGEIAEVRKQKLKMGVKARKREMSIKEKELELKEKELKKREINVKLKIEKMKLKMQERLAMEELRLKYK
ncbi:uncharacterized protein LOC126765745 [Bactrocera neohumeralis]|uniref:uncharacterized protein LOC126765745 n=1 Tax=Bactrocera neohumeralis TaxID=98809 RepID=UPI0021663D38|nr:uncharacterized protein LOC126765745 [Bactrocera neohumeralis]